MRFFLITILFLSSMNLFSLEKQNFNFELPNFEYGIQNIDSVIHGLELERSNSDHKRFENFFADHFIPMSAMGFYSRYLGYSLDVNFNIYLLSKDKGEIGTENIYFSYGIEGGSDFIKGHVGFVYQELLFGSQIRIAIWQALNTNNYIEEDRVYFGPEITGRIFIFVLKAGYMYHEKDDNFFISFGIGF